MPGGARGGAGGRGPGSLPGCRRLLRLRCRRGWRVLPTGGSAGGRSRQRPGSAAQQSAGEGRFPARGLLLRACGQLWRRRGGEWGSGGGARCAPHPRGKPGAAVRGGQNRSLLFLRGPPAPQGRRQSPKLGGVNCLAPTLRGGNIPHVPRGAAGTRPPGRGCPGRAAGQEGSPGPGLAVTFPPHLDGQEEGGWQLPGR